MNYKQIADAMAKGWLVFIPLSFLTPILMYQWRDNNRLIVMDAQNTYHVSEYSNMEQIRAMYEDVIRQGLNSFLMRNPSGFDNEKTFQAMFAGKAKAAALTQFKSEQQQFQRYQMHQKCEIRKIRIIKADKRRSFAKAEGQLIRAYVQGEHKYTFTVKFDAALEMITNYDLGQNAKYPFTITALKYEQSKLSEDEEKVK